MWKIPLLIVIVVILLGCDADRKGAEAKCQVSGREVSKLYPANKPTIVPFAIVSELSGYSHLKGVEEISAYLNSFSENGSERRANADFVDVVAKLGCQISKSDLMGKEILLITLKQGECIPCDEVVGKLKNSAASDRALIATIDMGRL